MAKHFTVICLPEDTYEVPSAALAVLDELHLSYCILETEGFDRAVRRYEILLPLKYNDGTTVEPEKFQQHAGNWSSSLALSRWTHHQSQGSQG